ncbi:MAG: TetR/AcrR family transcriptional regulator [Marvinbryantia sp.]|uniref:TetR/AcrR family transcriptional regulator n=1 Tax=Marvinbryantia sp. TaxID=2496532 RepID=UPI0025DA5E5F|nr:TetR/AcrR family transcriptional regulator [uncultured Marvinbryantia sp.]
MNEKFYMLSEEKQQRIIRAGWKVFSRDIYRKCAVGEIAKEADISKSLLFHYFKNKKELYLFLLGEAMRAAQEMIDVQKVLQKKDFFEILESGMELKLRMMKEQPELSGFVLLAYYEKDEEVAKDVQEWAQKVLEQYNEPLFAGIDIAQFAPGLDLEMMYLEMFWASDGCVRAMLQAGEVDLDRAQLVFRKLVDFWRSVYQRKDYCGKRD